MQCEDAKRQLDEREDILNIEDALELRRHLGMCSTCSGYRQELIVTSLLSAMPVRPASPGFEERVFRNPGRIRVKRGPSVHSRWALATAASIVLAVFLTLQFNPAGNPPGSQAVLQPVVVEVVPNQTQTINVRLNSERELRDARLTIELDDNLELNGYAGIRNLEWTTVIKPGENHLALPVQLLEGQTGTITIVIRHGNSSKRLSISVNAATGKNKRKITMV